MSLVQFLANIPHDILKRLGDLSVDARSESCRREINDLLQQTVLIGGKRLRPLLTFLMGQFFGLDLDACELPARAIEQVHAASLSHDDVVDNASTRRGKPSINVVASNKKAVLAGDYLLANVIVDLATLNRPDVVSEMAQVIRDLAEGEWLQLDAAQNRAYTRESLREIALKKTASVMSWCGVAPALIQNAPAPMVEYARQFGVKLGLAFQLMDDVLDFQGPGLKDQLLDLENGQVNSVLFEWLDLHPELFARYRSGESIQDLWQEKQFNSSLNQSLSTALVAVRTEAQQQLDEARNILNLMNSELGKNNPTDNQKSFRALEYIVDYLGQRSF
ncbi:MAG: hypothetical protein A2X86_13560 [Bdellovibrionales bacterium GWA2_49_15]|nr:MAG: hypothetical protein A2X86_13560 [Bdellovibrionales bacterium GWA2_49_15]HAZ13553.1 hypothetical protein [Bdellovibrionales bacterium]